MTHLISRFLQTCLVCILCLSPALAETGTTAEQPATELITQLQAGGYILYMRHGPTDHSQKDRDRADLDNCNKQRNLSDLGRDISKKIGLSIKQLGIPVGKVISSPYCRCKDTASLVFGDYTVDQNLGFSISKNREESRRLGNYLRLVMLNTDPGSSNSVFVGHTSNLKDGLGIWPKPEGVIIVFKKANDKLIFKGMISPDDWPAP